MTRVARRARAGLRILVPLALAAGSAFAAPEPEEPEAEKKGFLSLLRDSEDGALDLSEWLLDRKGFLPMPIVITEPAVGYGGGLALAFFRESIAEVAARQKPGAHVSPPDIFAGAFAGTENGTKFAGGGAMLTFGEDRWRYRGGVAWMDARLDYFGVGDPLAEEAHRIAYQLEGWFSLQQALYRIGDSRHFLGLRWVYFDAESRLEHEVVEPASTELEFETRSSGLGPSWEFDSRDNIFTPNRGLIAGIDTLFYREAIGSESDFETYRGRVFSYHPFGEAFILGLRLDGRAARGDVPFYQFPYIDLRGIPAVRYQDENTAVAEIELRYDLTARWAIVGFGGDGRAWGARSGFDDAEDRFAGGVGFRYKLARRLGLWAGIDVARGPEEEAFYLQVGSGWR